MAEHMPQAMYWLYLSSMPRMPAKNFSPPFVRRVGVVARGKGGLRVCMRGMMVIVSDR